MKLFTKDFTLVVIGQVISLFGNAVLSFALPLYLLRETDSSAVYGAVTACSFIPMVFFSLFGGVIADRANKRNIMVMFDSCTAMMIVFFGFTLERLPLVPLMTAIAQGMMGLGGIAGGIIAGTFGQKIKLKNSHIMLMVCSLTTLFMGVSLFNGIPKTISFAVIVVMSFSAMCSSTIFSLAMLTAVQKQTPPHLLGKIMALIMAVSSCSQPIGQAIYGLLFDVFSNQAHTVMIVSAVLAFMISIFSRNIFFKLQCD